MSSPSKLENKWDDLTPIEQNILLIHSHMVSPVKVDDLIKISGISSVDVVKTVERLAAKTILQEVSTVKNGYDLRDDRSREFLQQVKNPHSDLDCLKKVVRFYEESLTSGEQKTLLLAERYALLPPDRKALTCFKQAAEILTRQKKIQKTIYYYNLYLSYFIDKSPDQDQVDDYLNVVIDRHHVSRLMTPIEEVIPLFTKAYKIAKEYRKWEHLAKINYRLTRGLASLGQNDKASQYLRETEIIGQETGNRTVIILTAIIRCHQLFLKGNVLEALHNYEKSISSLDEFGNDNASLIADSYIGRIYVVCGRISRGIGLFDAVLMKANSLNFVDTIIFTNLLQAHSFLEIGNFSEAELSVNRALSFSECREDRLMALLAYICLAAISFSKGEYQKAFDYHKRAAKAYENAEQYAILPTSWFFEYLEGLESRGFYCEELNFETEVQKAIKNKNIFLKGIGYRFRALSWQNNGKNDFRVLDELRQSEKWLERAGASIDLAKTRMAIGNYFLKINRTESGNKYMRKAWESFPKIEQEFLPKELADFIPQDRKVEIMIDQIININDSLKNIKTLSAFLDKVINVTMEFSLATQCLFLKQDSKGKLKTLASRNLTRTHMNTESFQAVFGHITKIIEKGEEFIFSKNKLISPPVAKIMLDDGIHSMILMPVRLGKVTYGYISLINYLGRQPFPDNVLSYIRLICSQIAIGISNIEMYQEIIDLKNRFMDEATFYKQEMGITNPIEMMIGESAIMRDLKRKILQVSATDSSVLITGETGVGKELVAKEIHNLSNRKQGSFIPVNLAALPRELVISELFGYEKGAFTGANDRQKGRFEIANGGTIFLDEIGDLPPNVQAKILRVLQTGSFERLGNTKSIYSDFRVITATNKDLQWEVEKGSFRQDLYYRLAVFPIHVPPLRDREEDIVLLAEHFLRIFAKKIGKTIRKVPDSEFRRLKAYHWPGNVRELEHYVERSVILSSNGSISFSGLKPTKSRGRTVNGSVVDKSLAEIEKDHIKKTLESTFWKVSGPNGAAEILGLKPTTLLFRMKKLGIKKPYRRRM